jgi:hypothetical protein
MEEPPTQRNQRIPDNDQMRVENPRPYKKRIDVERA